MSAPPELKYGIRMWEFIAPCKSAYGALWVEHKELESLALERNDKKWQLLMGD